MFFLTPKYHHAHAHSANWLNKAIQATEILGFTSNSILAVMIRNEHYKKL